MALLNAPQTAKTVESPRIEYESLKPLWDRCRAVCNGERFVKDLDSSIDVSYFTNLLIPFSPSMTQEQYNFYMAEAEFPGITSQFAKMLVGGLLRKQPILSLPKDAPEGAYNWIIHNFGQDDSSLISVLDNALWEELQTSRAWLYISYPSIENPENLLRRDFEKLKPYPVLLKSDAIINWRLSTSALGKVQLKQLIIRGLEESYEKNEFHPEYIDTVWVHELDENGYYQIRIFRHRGTNTKSVISGQEVTSYHNDSRKFELEDTFTNIMMNGERLRRIPAWPLNGNIEPMEPMLMPIIDKELALYNKISRRNHLLYGASTYTPIVYSDMQDEDFERIVGAGLGSWIKLGQEDRADVLKTPTDALADMEISIAKAIEEMAKMGIRMLTPETAQSGVALELRNAAQTAQIGALNIKVSNTLAQVIAFMLNWRYGTEYNAEDIQFNLCNDFNPMPIGADWLRLVTEWYENGLVPRSVWLEIIKQNDLVPPEYNDQEGLEEINGDSVIMSKTSESYAKNFEPQMNYKRAMEEEDNDTLDEEDIVKAKRIAEEVKNALK